MFKVYVVDDHPMVTEGLEKAIVNSGLCSSCRGFLSAEELLAAAKADLPDVVISDISLPRMNGLEMAGRLKELYPSVRVVFLTMHQEMWRIQEIINLKASGLVFKTCPTIEIVNALHALSKGRTYFCAEAKDLIVQHSTQDKGVSLTPRERQVLELINKGFTSKQIAEALYLSENTIEAYRKTMFQKLNVNNATGLLAKAADLGFI